MSDRSGHKCAYCARKVRAYVAGNKRADSATLDHVVARENGGSNAATNLVVACRTCNSAKQDLTLKAFTVYLASLAGVKFTAAAIEFRVRAQLAAHTKIEVAFGNRAGKPQFSKKAA